MTPPSATPIERASEPSAARYVPPVDDLWRRSSSNPILVATEEWEGQSVERPAVLWEGGTDWKMWYTGEQTWYEGHAAIGFATSTDGIHWTKRGSNPVYGLGASDLTGPAFGTSVVRHAGTYYLYVSGDPGIRVATSADGIAWTTRESSITLPPDCDFWGALSVWMDGAVWRMFAVPWHLGLWDTYLYHSADGFNWTIDNDGQPLASLRLHPEGSYGAGSIATVNGVATPWFDGAYHLWYTAVDGPGYTPTDIYHATSTNLIDWTITPRSPVLRHLGTGFEFDQVSFPTVLVVGDLAYLYYEGSDNPAETHAIGVAIAPASITSVTAPPPSLVPSPAPSPSALPTPTTSADPFVGQVVVTVTSGLRVRSEPWVGDDSIRYEPLLPIGTGLRVLDGPVAGSGYIWYQVEPVSFEALQPPGYGWVALAGKDGEPWIAVAEPPPDGRLLVPEPGVQIAVVGRARLGLAGCRAALARPTPDYGGPFHTNGYSLPHGTVPLSILTDASHFCVRTRLGNIAGVSFRVPIDLYPMAIILAYHTWDGRTGESVSSGLLAVPQTWLFSLDRGALVESEGDADIWFHA